MAAEPVVLMSAFEVPEAEDDAFLHGWERSRDALRTEEGYLSTRLHRSISPVADLRFVKVALWQSEPAFGPATSRREFRNVSIPYPFQASLYEVVREEER